MTGVLLISYVRTMDTHRSCQGLTGTECQSFSKPSGGHTGEGKMGGSGFNEEEKVREFLHDEGMMEVA